jgi:nucleotide-binding universal stress UspA family protein
MKKILLPIDFSKTSENAFVYALELAKVFHAELVLLHTYEIPIMDSQVAPINFATIYKAIELTNFEHFRDELPKLHSIAEDRNLGHIVMNHILMDGDLVFSIKKVVKQEKIDFVVMGTKGTTDSWLDSLAGTNTGSIIRDVSIPVLSVPAASKLDKIETIAFTTRFREKDIEALTKTLAFAKSVGAKVKCLYIKTKTSDVTEEIIKRWKANFVEAENLEFFIIPNDDVKEAIESFLENQNIDMLAMATYKRNFFAKLFMSTTTQKLSYYLKTPILALHE